MAAVSDLFLLLSVTFGMEQFMLCHNSWDLGQTWDPYVLRHSLKPPRGCRAFNPIVVVLCHSENLSHGYRNCPHS